jgi:arylformamidase
MKTLFLSYFINKNTPIYGGVENAFITEILSSIIEGDTSNSSKYIFNNHIGTHIDFPFHFSNTGAKSNDYDSSFWVFNKVGFINTSIINFEHDINLLPIDIEILILKTNFGIYRGTEKYIFDQPVIPSNWAVLLRSKFPKLRVFGFDLISLTSKKDRSEGKKAHIEFLIKNNILIIEDMDLSKITECPSKLIVAPLLIESSDGVPCTIISFFE